MGVRLSFRPQQQRYTLVDELRAQVERMHAAQFGSP